MNGSGTVAGVGQSYSSPLFFDEANLYPALSRLNQLLSEKKYEEACTELILKLQTEWPANEEQLSLICRHYETIINEGNLEQSEVRLLRQNFLKFLKQLLTQYPFGSTSPDR